MRRLVASGLFGVIALAAVAVSMAGRLESGSASTALGSTSTGLVVAYGVATPQPTPTPQPSAVAVVRSTPKAAASTHAVQPRAVATNPPAVASAARVVPACPVPTWTYRSWTAIHDTTTYNSDKATAVGVYSAGEHIFGCQDPTGWVATFNGYVAPADVG